VIPVEQFLALTPEQHKAILFQQRMDLYCELMCRNLARNVMAETERDAQPEPVETHGEGDADAAVNTYVMLGMALSVAALRRLSSERDTRAGERRRKRSGIGACASPPTCSSARSLQASCCSSFGRRGGRTTSSSTCC
jgi:hypothetical protein